MQILGLLGMYFDAAVVLFTNSLLLFRLTMAILCYNAYQPPLGKVMYTKYSKASSFLGHTLKSQITMY